MDKKLIVRLGKDETVSISMLCTFSLLYVCRKSILTFAMFFHINTIVAAALIGLMGFSFFLYTFASRKNICWDGILLIAGIGLFFAGTLAVHPEYRDRFVDTYGGGKNAAIQIFTYGSGLYCYYIFRLHKNDDHKLYRLFEVVPFVLLASEIWSLARRAEDYELGFGYQMEMVAILFLGQYFYANKYNRSRKKRHRYKLLLSIFAMALGVLYGSRACVVGYAVFVLLYFIWERKLDRKKVIISLLGIAVAVTYSSQEAMTWIYNFFNSIGFHSRTLKYIARGNILAIDQARQNSIWPVLTRALREAPLYQMFGAFGDRYLLPDKWPYAHNFLLEVLLTFGKLLGGILLAAICWRFFSVIRNDKGPAGLLTIAFGAQSLCKLMFSSSFWGDMYFWIFIALLVNHGGRASPQNNDLRRRNNPVWRFLGRLGL